MFAVVVISIHTRSATYYEYAYCYCSVRGDGHTEMGDDSDIDDDMFIEMMQESDRLAPPEQRLEAMWQAPQPPQPPHPPPAPT